MKKINILYDLQLSVLTSQTDGDFIFNTDSNVNVASFTIKGLLKKNPAYEFYLLVPEKHKIVNFGKFFNDDRIHLLNYPYFGNPFVERMSFNPRVLQELLKDVKIDLIYTNDPSKVMQYKTFFYMKQNEFVPVMCRNHWVTGKLHRKVPEDIDFIIRQVEGVLYSKYATFNSETAIQMLLENAKEHFNEDVIAKIREKCYAMETVDMEKMDAHQKITNNRVPVILFAHRLSYYTGYEEVLEALSELYDAHFKFELYMPDPGNKYSQSELSKKYPFFIPIEKEVWTHESYIDLCWKADIVIGNHNIPTSWGGLALTEPMVALCAPVMPYKDAYKEMWYDNQDVFFTDKKSMMQLLAKYLSDNNFLRFNQLRARQFCIEKLSMENYITKINELINLCI